MTDYQACENAFLNGYAAAKNETEFNTIKDKQHKPPIHLILWKPLRWLIKIRIYGSKKYPDAENYKKVDYLDWYDACMRHLIAWAEGERLDPESGLPHTAHALCNLCYLIEMTEKEAEF